MDVKEKRLFDSVHRLLKTAVDTTATSSTADESDVVLMILDTFKRLLQWRELHKLVPKYSIKPFLTCMSAEVGDKMEMLNKRTFADDLGFQVLGSLLAQHHPSSVLLPSSTAEPILQASLRIFHWTYVGNKHTSDAVTLDRHSDNVAALDEHNDDDVASFRDKAVALVEMFCAGNSRTKAAMYRMLPVDLFVPMEDRPDLVSKYSMAAIRKSTKSASGSASSLLLGPFRSEPRFSAQSAAGTSTTNTTAAAASSSSSSLLSSAVGGLYTSTATSVSHVEFQVALRREIAALEAKASSMSSSPPPTPTTDAAGRRRGSVHLWDADQFTVGYSSFERELVVHGYFVEPLLPKLSDLNDPFEVSDPVLLAWHVLDRVGVETDATWRLRCVRCVRLLLRRYAMTFNGQLPVQSLLRHLRDAVASDPPDGSLAAFATECFLLFHVAISTSRVRTADSLVPTYPSVISAVVAALSLPPTSQAVEGGGEAYDRGEAPTNPHRLTFEALHDDMTEDDEHVEDAMVRAGVNVLAVIVQRARSYIPQVVAARGTLVQLFYTALRPSTLAALLALVEQLLPHWSNSDSFEHQVLPAILVACSNPINAGRMPHAAAALLCNYATPTAFQAAVRAAVGHDGCGLHLVLSDPVVLAAIFNADSVQAADVLWGATLRQRLFTSLASATRGRRRLSTTRGRNDSGGEYFDAHQHDPLVQGGDLDICVGHLFLKAFVEHEGSFRTTWTQTMYDTTIHALVARLSTTSRASFVSHDVDDDPMAVQVLVLRALYHLIRRAGHHVVIDASVLDVVLSPLKRSLLGEVDQARGGAGLRLLTLLLTPPNVNASTCLNVVISSFTLVHEAIDKTLQPRYLQFIRDQQGMICDPDGVALALVTALLALLEAVAAADDAYRGHPSLLPKLLGYVSVGSACPQVASAAVACVTRLCDQSSLLPSLLLVEGGGVVFLSHLVATTSTDNAAVAVAAAALLHAHEPLLHTVLVQLFTPGLLQVLAVDGPAAFVHTLHSTDDIYSARVIWTLSMQATLKETMHRELANVTAAAKDVNRWPVWDPDHFVAADSFRYLYADVADEVVVGGVFVPPDELRALAIVTTPPPSPPLFSRTHDRGGGGDTLIKTYEVRLDLLSGAIRKVGVACPELDLVVDGGFSDTESVGDDMANLVDMSPTAAATCLDGPPEHEQDDEHHLTYFDKQDSMLLDEIVV
ncbi:hypothetical protein DYB30_002105 [Aphanomyces astaci]|uniref:Uncharacterized protein n=2 Tax=Aphanomyces astaci TaxID=112090 RepID=A0A397DNJ9_APHAT|nr:hypothetical protein DYB30_002105 [Aphanomyces astaci]